MPTNLNTTDGLVWATAFHQQFPVVAVSDALGWFCNAIQRGAEHAVARVGEPAGAPVPQRDEAQVVPCAMPDEMPTLDTARDIVPDRPRLLVRLDTAVADLRRVDAGEVVHLNNYTVAEQYQRALAAVQVQMRDDADAIARARDLLVEVRSAYEDLYHANCAYMPRGFDATNVYGSQLDEMAAMIRTLASGVAAQVHGRAG